MKRLIIIVVIIALLLPEILSAQIYNNAYLTIKVNIDSVKITINNAYYGYASPEKPIIEELKTGFYTIRASKKGYKEETKVINLKPGDSSEIIFKLQRPDDFEVDKDKEEGIIGVEYGSMTVVVKMKGELVPAKVYIDNKFADNAPVSIKKLFSGVHEVTVEYKGYKKEEKVTIQRDSRKVYEIELLSTSKISIESKTKDITLKINNKKYNISSDLKLEKGTYNFKFSKYGYITAEKDIFIDGEKTYRLIAKLSQFYPTITPENINRMPPNTNSYSNKFKKKPENNAAFGAKFGFGLCTIIGLVNTKKPFLGALIIGGSGTLLGALIGSLIKNQNNIDYNLNQKYKKNKQISNYNEQTKKLIQQEQKKRYLENAIQVYEY